MPAHVATAKLISCPAAAMQMLHSSTVNRVKACRMVYHRSGIVRATAVRSRPFNLAKICLIELKSGCWAGGRAASPSRPLWPSAEDSRG